MEGGPTAEMDDATSAINSAVNGDESVAAAADQSTLGAEELSVPGDYRQVGKLWSLKWGIQRVCCRGCRSAPSPCPLPLISMQAIPSFKGQGKGEGRERRRAAHERVFVHGCERGKS